MAFDAFLTFDGSPIPIQGESMDKSFPNSIELRSLSFGVENIVSIGSSTGGAGAGKAKFNEIEITKPSDSASPVLFKMLVTGQHFKTVTINIRKAGGDKTKSGGAYERFTFSTVFVSKLTVSGSTGDDVPTETVILTYGALKWEYSRQDAQGNLTPLPAVQWSTITNSETMPA
jgi:type VI secretion system secreted protein Hcp